MRKYKYALLIAFIVTLMNVDISFAANTGGAEWNAAETNIRNLLGGAGGRILALVSLVFAIVGSVLKFNPIAVASSFGVAILATFGAAAITTGMAALI